MGIAYNATFTYIILFIARKVVGPTTTLPPPQTNFVKEQN